MILDSMEDRMNGERLDWKEEKVAGIQAGRDHGQITEENVPLEVG